MASSARNTNFFELFADSDSEAEFEGFGEDEIEAARNACTASTGDLGIFEIPDLDDDEDVPRDVHGMDASESRPTRFAVLWRR